MKEQELKKQIEEKAYKKAYGYWDNEYLRENDFCIKQSIKFGVDEAIQSQKAKTSEEIDNLIDYYTPYRPITDSSEAKAIREVLAKLKEVLEK